MTDAGSCNRRAPPEPGIAPARLARTTAARSTHRPYAASRPKVCRPGVPTARRPRADSAIAVPALGYQGAAVAIRQIRGPVQRIAVQRLAVHLALFPWAAHLPRSRPAPPDPRLRPRTSGHPSALLQNPDAGWGRFPPRSGHDTWHPSGHWPGRAYFPHRGSCSPRSRRPHPNDAGHDDSAAQNATGRNAWPHVPTQTGSAPASTRQCNRHCNKAPAHRSPWSCNAPCPPRSRADASPANPKKADPESTAYAPPRAWFRSAQHHSLRRLEVIQHQLRHAVGPIDKLGHGE